MNIVEKKLKQLELYKIEDTYRQWATVLSNLNLSIPDFQKQVAELESLISQLFDNKTPLRRIIIEGYFCSFRYSFNQDIVLVDFWTEPLDKIDTNRIVDKTMELPTFIYNYCNPMGSFVLESLILAET